MLLQSMNSSNYTDIFDFVLDGKNNVEDNYNFVVGNFQDNPLELMKALGRPLFTRIMAFDNDKLIKTGAALVSLQRSYNEKYTEMRKGKLGQTGVSKKDNGAR